MSLQTDLVVTAGLGSPADLETFRRHLDPELIEQALAATGTASLRKRRMPAEQVIWLMLGIALFRNRSIVHVADSLDLALPEPEGAPFVSSSAISQARGRLGSEPLAWLFERTARQWAHQSAGAHRWRGLALYGVDGSTLRTPDSPENREHFGMADSGWRGEGAYPLVRLVSLMALRSHLLAEVAWGPYATSEHELAAPMWARIPDHSLTILDRGFLAGNILVPLQEGGEQRHWLLRPKTSTTMRLIEQLGPGDAIVELNIGRDTQKANPGLPKTYRARAVTYTVKGKERTILTSLLDPVTYPAREVATLYEIRWEHEQGYDEIKTEELLSEDTLRSKTPERVDQEIWGILLVYNLIRLEMEQIAEEAEVEPVRISFVTSLRFIQDEWLWCATASPGSIPRHLKNLRATLKRFVLPERRTHRSYPRAVKIKMSSYKKKRREVS